MNVVVFGCGRTGASLALQLVSHGHQVTLIEQNPEALRRLGPRHGCQVVIGSGIDEDVLERAGIRNADAFFALTRGDNSNIMAAQLARLKYKVERVCLRVADPNRSEAYKNMGYFCINPSNLISGMMRDWFLGNAYESIDLYNFLPKEMEI
ncbi:MAG TPA: TrkA family potassium uptake protein [Fimbriimonadaceae bacterium]|nr:TrkA family potassium uptake protein [Fimbriimonadaceae bacterium]